MAEIIVNTTKKSLGRICGSLLQPKTNNNKTSYLKIIGDLAENDFDYLNKKILPVINCLDLSSVTNIELPSLLFSSKVQTSFSSNAIKEIILPNKLSSISEALFSNCTSLEKIVIPDTIISISRSAFEGCCSLKEIVVSKNLIDIQEDAFKCCSSLEKIYLPNTVTNIGNSFNNCKSLYSFTLPESLKNLNSQCFHGCISLSAFSMHNLNKNFLIQIQGDAIIIYNKLTKSLVTALHMKKKYLDKIQNNNITNQYDEFSIKEEYQKHNHLYVKNVFYKDVLILVNGIENICEKAFCDIHLFTKIIFPKTLKNIEKNSFYNCSIYYAEIPPSFTKITTRSFQYSHLISITLPKTVTIIESDAFNHCTYLTNINFPNGLIEIHDLAFASCKNLKRLNFPYSVKKIGKRAFSDCDSIEFLKLYSTTEISTETFLNSNIKQIFLIQNINEIKSQFQNIIPYFNNLKRLPCKIYNEKMNEVSLDEIINNPQNLISLAYDTNDVSFNKWLDHTLPCFANANKIGCFTIQHRIDRMRCFIGNDGVIYTLKSLKYLSDFYCQFLLNLRKIAKLKIRRHCKIILLNTFEILLPEIISAWIF